MLFKKTLALITILLAFCSLPSFSKEKNKPFEYYIEHEGEQSKKPKYTKGTELNDVLLPLPETPREIKKREKQERKAARKKNKTKKPPKYKKSKRIKSYKFKDVQRKNKAPLTFAEYLEMCKDVKRADIKVPSPNYPKDDKLVNLPEPDLEIVKYNTPPGAREIELTQLTKNGFVISHAVLSPDKLRSVYTKVFYYPGTQQVASEIYTIDIPEGTSITKALRDYHTIDEEREPVIRAGTDLLFNNEKRVLSLLDWSEDGQKIAVVEKIGALTQGPWKTQIRTYDFETQTAYELTALREAIRYYWRTNKNLDLIDYMWDIFPLGWDAIHKDRIICYAYAFNKDKKSPKFLGTWSIDYKNQRPELMSVDGTDFEVTINGYALKFTNE